VIDDPYNPDALAFEFPMQAPAASITRHNVDAISHLEIWKKFAVHWCEHKPSITVYIAEDEWLRVGAWCYENFTILSGVSFLPKADNDHSYVAAPYEEITSEEYSKRLSEINPIDWELVQEAEDNTTSSQELACTADACEM
jgi:ribonucleoside-diphosphate reductase alpha chain